MQKEKKIVATRISYAHIQLIETFILGVSTNPFDCQQPTNTPMFFHPNIH